ncbi:MAG TPA: LysR substrate-binding domain-containing protein [Ramlibacter sp.]|uniref:LysR substrate-binding domain-containing protein n=1 Tax=Ramlibacter sp. TaxID=1917967 RepID=UPI002BC94A38|nr:LysR substrate-binding domain-containing protein [Ramlibacter sp.]HVZ44827.1 LysR substrate-binding domain-containing protein [Ramlibacter sp.]
MTDPLRQVTLRQLQIFIAAATGGGYARAGEQLHMTQPAISMQMTKLSACVGLPLFEKRGRSVHLTRAGEQLLPYARRIEQTLREASEAIEAFRGLRHGAVRVGLVTTARHFAPRLVSQFRVQHPEIEVEVSIANREGTIALLEESRIDVAVMGRPPPRLPVVAHPFARHPHGIIASPDHPLARRRRLPPERLAEERFIVREPGSGTRDAMEMFLAEHHVAKPRISQEMTSNESIKQAVIAGMGLAFISLHTVELERRAGQLVLLDVKGLPVARTWYVLHAASHILPPAGKAFLEFMRTDAPALMESIFPGSGKVPRR